MKRVSFTGSCILFYRFGVFASNQGTDVPVPDGYTTALVLLIGALPVNRPAEIRTAEVGLFDRAGKSISIECVKDTTALLVCDGPIDEPIVGQGRFVMNTSQELRQAMADYLRRRLTGEGGGPGCNRD